MEARDLLNAINVAERLKDTTRHCYTKNGRHESVVEHSWMMTLMAYFMKDEFPEADINKVIQMCIIHDLGECFTGDIPTFDKTKANEKTEALVQHNISDLSTWIPKEYELNKTYADDKVEFSEYLKGLREEIRKDTLKKIGEMVETEKER